jgi:HD-like signal output (HDOD) protein
MMDVANYHSLLRSWGPDDFEGLKTKFESAESLPDMPAAAMRVCEAIDRGTSGAAELERIVLADPALTASILKVANSPLHGGGTKQTTTVKGAIVALGERSVRSIAVSVWVQSLIQQSQCSPSFSAKQFSEHSLFVGFLAKYLLSVATRARGANSAWNADEIFAAGVLHDLGIGLVATVEPGLYDHVLRKAQSEGTDLNTAFSGTIGRPVQDLALIAADNWKLPQMFKDVIAGYSEPLKAPAETVALCCVNLADMLATKSGFSLCGWTVSGSPDPGVIERVGLDPESVPEVIELTSRHTREFVAAA